MSASCCPEPGIFVALPPLGAVEASPLILPRSRDKENAREKIGDSWASRRNRSPKAAPAHGIRLVTARLEQPELAINIALPPAPRAASPSRPPLLDELRGFREFGTGTRVLETQGRTSSGEPITVPTFVNEFWTARQRQASSLHEVSYRACFKPQLPRFFIERLTRPGDAVYDPFMGRGTTVVEAALLGRVPCGCDINPLSRFLVRPRLNPPRLEDIARRLEGIPLHGDHELSEDLLVFYHPQTLQHLCSLRAYLLERSASGTLDAVDEWIWMVALNRLTGHSNGFFSVYTLPPNQATSATAQRRINHKRNQTPPPRDVGKLILKKSRQLLKDCDEQTRATLSGVAASARLLTEPATATPQLPANSIALAVTSPPFLDVVNYAGDNWLRCWFIGVDPDSVRISMHRKLPQWQETMTGVFRELARVLQPGGHVAFEVGEIRGGQVKLEEAVLPCGVEAGLEPVLVLINDQDFTKTANCWGVDNNAKGTNTNRIALFRKG